MRRVERELSGNCAECEGLCCVSLSFERLRTSRNAVHGRYQGNQPNQAAQAPGRSVAPCSGMKLSMHAGVSGAENLDSQMTI